MNMLSEIEKYKRGFSEPIADTKLGRLMIGDPNLMITLRQGRVLRLSAAKKIREFIKKYPDPQQALKDAKNKINPATLKKNRSRKCDQSKAILRHNNSIRNVEFTSDTIRYDNRDPCFYCGIRGDLGCKHKPKSEEI